LRGDVLPRGTAIKGFIQGGVVAGSKGLISIQELNLIETLSHHRSLSHAISNMSARLFLCDSELAQFSAG